MMKHIILTVLLSSASLILFAQPFVTVWKTDNPGVSENNQITIPTTGGGYNYNISWEQIGNPAVNGMLNNQASNATITFPAAGSYRVSITGSFPRIYFYNDAQPSDARKLLAIEQWGNNAWTSMEGAFWGCTELSVTAGDVPDLNNVTSLGSMFRGALNFNQNIGAWDVSNVTRMDSLFYNALLFNQDISGWDVSNVTDMRAMFWGNQSFNQNIGGWNVGSVTNMSGTFLGATAFNQDIGSWNVSSVTDMEAMFFGASSFNQDIGAWDVGNVTNMASMFGFATAFNQNIGAWNLSNVTEIFAMFLFATAFNQDIGNWDVSNVTAMSGMFSNATSFNQNIGNWNVANVTTTSAMFFNAASFNQNIGGWSTGNVINMSSMFAGAAAFNQDIGNWNVSNVTDMRGMFFGATAFNQDIGAWDVSSVTTMGVGPGPGEGGMFQNAAAFDQSLANWNVSNVIDMEDMFSNSGLSDANYDATLIGWATRTLQSGVLLGAEGLGYCEGATARYALTHAPNNWIITGDALICEEVPELEIYNVVTTHKNGKHDFLNIKNITFYPENKLSIFDRWGNKVYEHDGYDNVQVVFTGISDDNKELPDGTYFYVLDKNNGDKPIHGFIYLRK